MLLWPSWLQPGKFNALLKSNSVFFVSHLERDLRRISGPVDIDDTEVPLCELLPQPIVVLFGQEKVSAVPDPVDLMS